MTINYGMYSSQNMSLKTQTRMNGIATINLKGTSNSHTTSRKLFSATLWCRSGIF